MKPSELRAKSVDELKTMLAEKRAEYAEKRRSLHAGELSNVRSITNTRREIARLSTLISEQQKAPAAAKEEK